MSNTYEFKALGTIWWIELISAKSFTTKLKKVIDYEVGDFAKKYSRFDDNSLVGQLNINKHLKQPPTEMLQMLAFAESMFKQSGGIFNISVGGKLNELGYGAQKQGKIVSDFWEKAVINDNEIVIPKESSVDFGGFGKGWLVDKLVKIVEQSGVPEFIVNGGGDLFVRSNYPIEIGLKDPLDPSKIFGNITLQNQALAASSNRERSWQSKDGKTVHHIIDPRSDLPTEQKLAGTFVIANSTLIADTCSTILMIEPGLGDKLCRSLNLQTKFIYEP